MNRGRRLHRFAFAAALALAGCAPAGTPEDAVRALVDEAVAAAEARDASALKDFVADDYADLRGRDASAIRALLHGWLVAHPSVNLLARVDSIELEGTELARVEVTVGLLGREAKGESGWDLAADVERLELRLARDGGDWRVVSAVQR
jgi:hypothetical protein